MIRSRRACERVWRDQWHILHCNSSEEAPCQCVEESNNSYLTLFVHVVEQYGCDIEQYLDTMVVYNCSPICRIRLTLILGPGSNSIETPKGIHLISSQC